MKCYYVLLCVLIFSVGSECHCATYSLLQITETATATTPTAATTTIRTVWNDVWMPFQVTFTDNNTQGQQYNVAHAITETITRMLQDTGNCSILSA